MNNIKACLTAAALTIGLAGAANAAVYVKYDGVDGEAKAAEWGSGNSLWLTLEEDTEVAGLLLPAVQSAREAARGTASGRTQSRASVLDFTDTSAGMHYTLHGAKISPVGGDRVRIDYNCKDWRNLRNGREGSDCRNATKGGNAETTWKVEKGEG